METKRIYESNLVGGSSCKTQVWPVSSTQAVYSHDVNGDLPDGVEPILEDRLQVIEAKLTELENKLKAIEDALSGGSSDGGGDGSSVVIPKVSAISLEDIRALIAEGDSGDIIECSSAEDDGVTNG